MLLTDQNQASQDDKTEVAFLKTWDLSFLYVSNIEHLCTVIWNSPPWRSQDLALHAQKGVQGALLLKTCLAEQKWGSEDEQFGANPKSMTELWGNLYLNLSAEDKSEVPEKRNHILELLEVMN